MECFFLFIGVFLLLGLFFISSPAPNWVDPVPSDADRAWRFGPFQSVVYIKEGKIHFLESNFSKSFMLSTIGSVGYVNLPSLQNTTYNKLEVYSGGTIAMSLNIPKGPTSEQITDDIQRYIDWYHKNQLTPLQEPPHLQAILLPPSEQPKKSADPAKIVIWSCLGLMLLIWIVTKCQNNNTDDDKKPITEVTSSINKPSEIIEELSTSESSYNGSILIKAKILVAKKTRSSEELTELTEKIFKYYTNNGNTCQLDIWDSKAEYENLQYYFDKIDTKVVEDSRNKRWKKKHWVKICESNLSSKDSFSNEVILYPYFDSQYREYGGKMTK